MKTPNKRKVSVAKLSLLFLASSMVGGPFSAVSAVHAKPKSTADVIETHHIGIQIYGVNDIVKQNILNHLLLVKLQDDYDLTFNQIEQLIERSKHEIQVALEPFGYYEPKIHAEIAEIANQNFEVNFYITLGPAVIVTDIRLDVEGTGQSNNEILTSLNHFPLKEGDVLLHEIYEEGKKEILASALKEGFLDSEWQTHEILVDKENHTAQIHLVLNTHSIYTVGQFRFSPTPFADFFLKRFAQFDTNTPYSAEKVMAFQTALQESDYFNVAEVTPEPNSETHEVLLDVNLDPLKPNKYTFGLGYGTDTGIRGRAGWERRYLNRYGHRFKLDVKGGEKNDIAKIDADYIIPGHFPNTDQYRIHAGFYNEEFVNEHSRVEELGINEVRKVGDWQRTLSLSYRIEHFQDFDRFIERNEALILPVISLVKVKSDDMFKPTMGYRFGLQLKGAIGAVFSDTTFFQVKMDYKFLKALSENGKIILRTELGATLPDDIDRIPLTQRFYAGGDNSIRGFAYRSLPSQRDANGQFRAVGGGYLATGSLEYEYRVKGPFSLAVFTDGGNAFHNSEDKPQLSVGTGFRYATPIGPLRFDLAKPVTTSQARSLRIHVSFGPEL